MNGIMPGLKRLHDGRSYATSGVLAELLSLCPTSPTPEHPSPPHLLAPALLNLLGAAFMLGHVPDLADFAPVTPIIKKGLNFDPAIYRSIAVSAPILRLYANILNARVISRAESAPFVPPLGPASGLPFPRCTLILPSSTSTIPPPVHTHLCIGVFLA